MFKQLGDLIIQDLALESNYIFAPEYMFIFYKVINAYRKAAKDMENKGIFKKIILIMRKSMNTVIVRRSFNDVSVKDAFAKSERMSMEIGDIKENILEMAEEMRLERYELIKAKVRAEKMEVE